jgi:hypothetical protein
MQKFLVSLVSKIEFTPSKQDGKVRMGRTLVIVPVIEGQIEQGAQILLYIKHISRGSDALE